MYHGQTMVYGNRGHLSHVGSPKTRSFFTSRDGMMTIPQQGKQGKTIQFILTIAHK